MGMVRFVSVCQSQIYKNYCNPITQSSENRFLRILEFVIEVKNRNNERIWVHPSDMGIVGVVFLRWIWIYKKIWNPPTQSWENRILVNSIVHNQVLHCFFSLKTEILLLSDFTHFMSNILWFILHKKGNTLYISFEEKNSLKVSPGGGREQIENFL